MQMKKISGGLGSNIANYIPIKYHYSILPNSNEEINPINSNEKGIDYLIGNDPEILSKYSRASLKQNNVFDTGIKEKLNSFEKPNDDLEASLLGIDEKEYLKPMLYKEDTKDLTLKLDYDSPKTKDYALYELRIVRAKRKGYGYSQLQKFQSSRDVYEAFHERAKRADREEFLVLLLDIKNYMIGFNVVSVGTLNYVIVHPREVFKPAIISNAASIILAHNHPSGNPEPSDEDIRITKKLKDAGELLGIDVLDHVIIGDRDYFSFIDKGML